MKYNELYHIHFYRTKYKYVVKTYTLKLLSYHFQVAQENQKTFTDLVRQLVGRFTSDIEKARTIFRWITVKNLNTMQFDDDLRGDTPMGLLRGIKFGTESYHVLFKRLCRFVIINYMVY